MFAKVISHPIGSAVLLALLLGAGPTAVPDSPPNLPNWPEPKVAPFLSAEEAIGTMKLAPGFHSKVVAAEPLASTLSRSLRLRRARLFVEIRSLFPTSRRWRGAPPSCLPRNTTATD